jgi:2-polyprenyl-6-methoxyphenol hydroxylase-like FAD-dependent oxidoreductase
MAKAGQYKSERPARLPKSTHTVVRGDVVVGADGVHSVARLAVTDKDFRPFQTNHSSLRFLITRESALADSVTHDFATTSGSMDMWYGPDRKVVIYPCADNTLLNFVCIHPAALSNASDDYNQIGSKSQLLEIYQYFEERVVRLLQKAEPETLKLYPLFDMETLPTFVNDKLVLIGDAAHPFTPHLAQGGAMAIEDAFSLGVMLPAGTTPDDIPQRLLLYNKARYERATTIQNYSRIVGGDGVKKNSSPASFKCTSILPSSNPYH